MSEVTGDNHRVDALSEKTREDGTQGPPAFLVDEVVKIAHPTGNEVDDMGEVLTPSKSLGVEGVVRGALPSSDEKSWLMQVGVKEDGEESIWEIPEVALERTGLAEIREEGAAVRLPLDQAELNPWRDDVLLTLETNALDWEEAERIAEEAAARLRGIEGVSALDRRLIETRNEPFEITFWVYGHGNTLDLYKRITALGGSGWSEDADRDVFLQADWSGKLGGQDLLTPGVKAATAVYRRWRSPERPWSKHAA